MHIKSRTPYSEAVMCYARKLYSSIKSLCDRELTEVDQENIESAASDWSHDDWYNTGGYGDKEEYARVAARDHVKENFAFTFADYDFGDDWSSYEDITEECFQKYAPHLYNSDLGEKIFEFGLTYTDQMHNAVEDFDSDYILDLKDEIMYIAKEMMKGFAEMSRKSIPITKSRIPTAARRYMGSGIKSDIPTRPRNDELHRVDAYYDDMIPDDFMDLTDRKIEADFQKELLDNVEYYKQIANLLDTYRAKIVTARDPYTVEQNYLNFKNVLEELDHWL